MIKELKDKGATLIDGYRIIIWERREVSLTLSINGSKYNLRKGETIQIGKKIWMLDRIALAFDKRIAGVLKMVKDLDVVELVYQDVDDLPELKYDVNDGIKIDEF